MKKIQKKKNPLFNSLNYLNFKLFSTTCFSIILYLFLFIFDYSLKISYFTFSNSNYITFGYYNSWVIFALLGNIMTISVIITNMFNLNNYTRFESFLGNCYILVVYNAIVSIFGSINFNYLAKNFGFEFNFSNYLYNLLMLIFFSLVVLNILMFGMKLFQNRIIHFWKVIVTTIIAFIVALLCLIFMLYIITYKRSQYNFSGFSKQIFSQLNNFYEHTFNFYSKTFSYVNFTLTLFTLIIIMLWFLYGKFKKYDKISFT